MRLRAFAALFPLAAIAAGVPVAGYGQQQSKPGHDDLAALMSHYVDSTVETRQFLAACAPGRRSGWDEGAAMLVASLRAEGLASTGDLAKRLAASSDGAVVYDCSNDASKLRIGGLIPGDWTEVHRRLLQTVRVREVAADAEADPRIASVRAAISAHVGPQADMLNCMSLIHTEFLAIAWIDWNDSLDRAAAAIRNAGYAEDIADAATKEARSANLIRPVKDRQAEIAACAADEAWLTRYATFASFTVVGDVEAALGARN